MGQLNFYFMIFKMDFVTDEIREELPRIKNDLRRKGYCIIHNVLTEDEIEFCRDEFSEWVYSSDQILEKHHKINPHGIFKYFEAAHQRFAWYIRTRPKVIGYFQGILDSTNVTVSFDSCCYMESDYVEKEKCWTHTDQASNKDGWKCYQGFVSLTNNKNKSLMLYEGSHKMHKKYFEDRNISNSNDWNLIEESFLDEIKDRKKLLNVPKGSLVLWDSRTFHQNYTTPGSRETRFVQYVCFLNKDFLTKNMRDKKLKYFADRRATNHWPYPVKVISKQPRTFGNDALLVNYEDLKIPTYDDLDVDGTPIMEVIDSII
ncbi:phytanoyl-CoA dioxygenase [Carp edema virus]|nr:phytanoyl-CoA dioxygenase [Carp edema virus]